MTMIRAIKNIHILLAFTVVFSFLLVDNSMVVTTAAPKTNDRYIGNQTHLSQIHADTAWQMTNSNTGITIAVLDSGVDSDHPDLKGNLVPGVNLVQPGRSPEDDFGHGTQVAGILAAKGNNGIGVSGVLWNARIMPIKVLDKNGEAQINTIAKGIEQAIQRKAKIILMSFESPAYSKELEAAVNRAEANGVILVAASGNEGGRVSFPAAYPTVISVGALQSNNIPIYQSNFGPELKLMAPGRNIYTTSKGGGYGSMSGTSAAAPQVAGAAALILARNPKMSPLEVRQLLYQTAKDLGQSGWDKSTGYGLLDVSRAVRTRLLSDISEPNNSQPYAKAFPIESQLRAQFTQSDTMDWYYMDLPYDGKVSLSAAISSRSSSPLAITFFPEGRSPSTFYMGNGNRLTVPVKQGKMYIKMQPSGGIGAFSYLLTSHFTINPDSYERNDDMNTARPLVGNQIGVVGNFHAEGDEDWFSYYVREYGKLNVTVGADTNRIDLRLYVKNPNGAWDQPYDSHSGRDDPTERAVKEVSPGKYYIRLIDYWGNAVNGEYKLDVNYTPVYKDVNEPNDTYRLASRPASGYLMTGIFMSTSDYDWYQFDVDANSYVSIRAPQVPVSSGVRLVLYNSRTFEYPLYSQPEVAELSDEGRDVLGLRLGPGKYYIRMNSVVPFKYDPYRMILSKEKLIDGYRDITYHWARSDIARLSNKGVVHGFDDATFRPDALVTRAQFATMLIESIKAKGTTVSSYSGRNPFSDISRSHWAYNNIASAYRLGILRGYPNKTIKPNQLLTRAEMAVMVARAQNVLLYKHSFSSYRDVSTGHWASPAIEALTTRGWLHGYGYSFKPQAFARRAEMVVLLAKAYKL